MSKALMTLTGLSIPGERIKPLRDDSRFETSFALQAKVKVVPSLTGETDIDALDLEWIETSDWFEFVNKTWTFRGTNPNNVDVHALHPDSKTFTNWRTLRYLFALVKELGNAPPPPLEAAVANAGNRVEDRERAAKHWIAENGFEWTLLVAVDKPGLGLNPNPGSGGGAGGSLVTTNSRRRVLYFELGFRGYPKVTATQILESVDGVPTLHTFLVPGETREVVNDEANLAKWRLH